MGEYISDKNQKRLNKSGIKAIIAAYKWLFIQSVFMFFSAGDTRVMGIWIYIGIVFIFSTISSVILWKKIPEVANERGELKKDTEPWDKMLLVGIFIMTLLVLPVVIGLDVGRFKGSNLGIHYTILGIFLYCIAFCLNHWAIVTNKHFEGTVRIQKDRDHKVVTTGPYKIIRHPGYVGMILWSISTPLIIGSVYGLIPSGVIVGFIIVRTALEDKTLHRELPGYSEYAKIVRHKIFPGIW